MTGSLSLNSMLQRELKNEVPDAVLQQCPEADRVLAENVLRVAQAELVVLNLASTTVSVEGRKITLKCMMTGPSPSVSLSSMRNLQAYSPGRVLDLRTMLHEGHLFLLIDLSDSLTRISTTELEVVRVIKKRRMVDRLMNT